MASVYLPDEENSSGSESDISDESDSDEYSVVETDNKVFETQPCRFYNSGGCRDGHRCPYLHVCKYALKGNCRNGSKCKLSHNTGGRPSSGARNRPSNQSTSRDEEQTTVPDEENSSGSESDISDESDSDEYSVVETDNKVFETQPCRFYNSGGCRDGHRCPYLHVCKYALKGNCRNGSKCKLSHNTGGRPSSGARNRPSNQSTSRDEEQTTGPILTDGRFYQWQLNDGNSWMDVDNDHVIEAQFSLPHTKSITIYGTPYGAVIIDFNRMRVYGKSLRVRRLDDGNTEWIWYCTLRCKWNKYGDKDSRGKPGPVKSSDIERKFQSNPKSAFTFSIGGETLEIRFREMQQVGKSRRRRVTRRPLYRQKQAGAGFFQAASAFQNLSLGSKQQWQFEGNRGAWHWFKRRSGSQSECSVTSEDIERKYQQNPYGGMSFTVKGQSYKLDFGAMIQTNLTTKNSRKIRRVPV